MVLPEFCIRVAPTQFTRQLVEEPDSNRVIVSYDWVSACLSQGRLVDVDSFKLRSSPLDNVDTGSREFNQYRPSDLISIQMEELAKSMDPIEETGSLKTETPVEENHPETDFFSSIYEPTDIHQTNLLDRLAPPLVPSAGAELDTLSHHAHTYDLDADASGSHKGDASTFVHEIDQLTPPASPGIAAPLDTHLYDNWGNPIEEISSFELARTEWPENEPDHESCVSDDGGQWVSLSLVDILKHRS